MFTKILRGLYTGFIFAAVFATLTFGGVLLITAIFGEVSWILRLVAIVTIASCMWYGVYDEFKGGDDLDDDTAKEFEA